MNHVKLFSEFSGLFNNKILIMTVLTKSCFLILLSFFAFNAVLAQSLQIELNWKQQMDTVKARGEINTYPGLENVYFDGESYVHLSSFNRSSESEKWEMTIESFASLPISKEDRSFLDRNNFDVYESISYSVNNVRAMGDPLCNLSVFPFVEINGSIEKLTSVIFQISKTNQYQTKSNEFAANSVLAPGSGDWYKISVDQNGIYRLSYEFLASIGIDMNSLNPASINIYGNAFGKLPEDNAVERPDDLIKNDIYIQGEGDGSFDPGDFILFYGRGPHKWEQTGTDVFARTINNYSNVAAYFINVNNNETPARIQSADLSSLTETNTVTDYNNYTIYERELTNLIKGGQRWYGEVYDSELSQSYSFFLRNLNPNETGYVRSFFACSEGSSGGSTNFNISYNGSSIGNANLSAVGSENYSRNGFISFPGAFNPNSSSFSLNVTFNRTSPSDIGYLDFVEVNARSYLDFGSGTMEFRDLNSVGSGNVSLFQISNFPYIE